MSLREEIVATEMFLKALHKAMKTALERGRTEAQRIFADAIDRSGENVNPIEFLKEVAGQSSRSKDAGVKLDKRRVEILKKLLDISGLKQELKEIEQHEPNIVGRITIPSWGPMFSIEFDKEDENLVWEIFRKGCICKERRGGFRSFKKY